MTNFDELQLVFANAFISERLIFRPFEDNEADKEFSYQLLSDPLSQGLASIGRFSTMSRQAADDIAKEMKNAAMINMVVCLKPEEAEARGEYGDKQLIAKSGEGSHADKEAKLKSEFVPCADLVPIGRILLTRPSRNHETAHVRATELGIRLKESYWNRGYGTEAVNWALDYAFKFVAVHRVELATASYNERAAACYEKVGFKLEGRKRHALFVNLQWYDHLLFGILEDEWRALRGLK